MSKTAKIVLAILTGGLAIIGFAAYAIFKAKNEETVECDYVECDSTEEGTNENGVEDVVEAE